jgi:hypothetical protein
LIRGPGLRHFGPLTSAIGQGGEELAQRVDQGARVIALERRCAHFGRLCTRAFAILPLFDHSLPQHDTSNMASHVTLMR